MKKILIYALALCFLSFINSMENHPESGKDDGLNILELPYEIRNLFVERVIKYEIDKWIDIFNFDNKSLKKQIKRIRLVSKNFNVFEPEELENFVKKLKQDRFEYLKNRIKEQYSNLSKEKLDQKLKKLIMMPTLNEKYEKEAIRLCIAGADVNIQGFLNETVLTHVIRRNYMIGRNYIQVIKLLMDNGANVNHKDHYGWTPLTLAILNGYLELIKLFIDNGADVNFKNSAGWTPLMEAIDEGRTEAVMLLIANGAHVKFSNDDVDKVLTKAAKKGCTELVKLLLNNGANIKNINKKDSDGFTALMLAAQEGHVETAKLLLNSGANVNIQDPWRGTALMQAAKNGHTKMVKLLLNNGADINIDRNGGLTALKYAVQNGNTKMVNYLNLKRIKSKDEMQ